MGVGEYNVFALVLATRWPAQCYLIFQCKLGVGTEVTRAVVCFICCPMLRIT